MEGHAIKKVGIVGGGKMAAEIFRLCSDHGYEVTLWTRRSEVAAALDEELKKKLRRKAKRGGDEGLRAEAQMARMTATTDIEALRDVDLISESITELLAPKRELFNKLDAIVKPEAIFTTNTSGLSPSSFAEVTRRPERFAGLHFFYPASILNFIEVIPTSNTASAVTEQLTEFVKSLGKRPIPVRREVGCYVVNRILLAYYNEGAGIVGEGHWLPGQVDACAKRFAVMGPLESSDQVGIDVLVHSQKSSDESWGEVNYLRNQTRGWKHFPPIFDRMFRDSRFGAKNGLGFYRYENRRPLEDSDYFRAIAPTLPDYHTVPNGDESDVELRCLYNLLLEVILTEHRGIGLREDIEFTIKQVMGLEKGPFEMMASIGLAQMRETSNYLAAKFGPQFAPVGFLAETQ